MARPLCSTFFSTANQLRPQEINYELRGPRNAPVLVFLHGMGGSIEAYRFFAQRLSKDFRTLIYDQRGHGASVAKGYDYSTHTMAEDLRVLLDHLQIDSVILVGSSMGARIASRFTATYPHRVKGLLVEDMDLMPRTNPNPKVAERVLIKARHIRKALQETRFFRKSDLAQALAPLFNQGDHAAVMDSAVQTARGDWVIPTFPPDVYTLYWYQANTDNFVAELARVQRPTLILRADTQSYWSAMTDEGVRRILRDWPEADVRVVAGADHSVHSSRPREFFRLLMDFVSRVN